jgi:2-haloacid dehalogenase
MSELRWVTFDCFGTLVDWRHGITTAADLLYPGRGAELLEAYNRHEPVIQTETPGMRYREVMTEALRRATTDAGLELLEDNADVLAATIPYWPVFPDTRAALAELRRADWRLALLTNCDRDLIAQTQRRLGVPVDAVVTAEDVGAYKPSHDHFTRFERSFGASRDRWVHVAQSWVHDMVPAKALRIPRVWVNRHHDPQDPAIADAVMPDLSGLLETVEQVRGAAT